MDRWKATGMATFSYGVLARSFLSRGLKPASDAGSNVVCIQPPSMRPSNRKAIPRTAIATSVYYAFGTRRCSVLDSPMRQLTEKTVTLPGLPWSHPHSPQNLLQECRIMFREAEKTRCTCTRNGPFRDCPPKNGPITLTIALPGIAYCIWGRGGTRTAALWAPDCDGIVTVGHDLSRISAVLHDHPSPVRQ